MIFKNLKPNLNKNRFKFKNKMKKSLNNNYKSLENMILKYHLINKRLLILRWKN